MQSDIRLGMEKIVDNIESGSDDEDREDIESKVSVEELEKRYNRLRDKEDWDEECEMCERPVMLHEEKCTRKKK